MGPNTVHCTWSSPALGEVNGRTLVIFGGGDGTVYAFEPIKSAPAEGQVENLKLVWKFDCDPTGPKENVHRYMGNRKESASNIMSMPVLVDGRVYVTSGGDMWWGKNQGTLKCIDARGEGDITKTNELWSYPLKRTCSTPAVYNGLVFAADGSGAMHCVDAATGKGYWMEDGDSENWASPFVADGKMYMGTRRGDLWVLAAEKEKKLLAKVKLDSAIAPTVTAANGVLYVATMRKLYAVQK